MTPDDLIERLGMRPHPEGGHYVEVWRGPDGPDGRAVGTSIYFLLRAGERSHWHRVDATEIWHHYAGGPLELSVHHDGVGTDVTVLGDDLAAGEVPQGLVPPHAWQAARPLAEWTLVGCTVSPGFEFRGFELAPPAWQPPS